jgi:hypothetical protein
MRAATAPATLGAALAALAAWPATAAAHAQAYLVTVDQRDERVDVRVTGTRDRAPLSGAAVTLTQAGGERPLAEVAGEPGHYRVAASGASPPTAIRIRSAGETAEAALTTGADGRPTAELRFGGSGSAAVAWVVEITLAVLVLALAGLVIVPRRRRRRALRR